MNKFTRWYGSSLFERVPKEQQTRATTGWGSKRQRCTPVPYPFSRGMLLTSDGVSLVGAGLIGFTSPVPIITLVGLELLYLGICALLLLARTCKQFWVVVGIYLIAVGGGMLLNLAFPGIGGIVVLYVLCLTVLYRFPLEWSLPLAGVCILALITTDGALPLLPVHPSSSGWTLIPTLLLACVLCWVGWLRRTQLLLILRLHQTQETLKEQMKRGEALAAEQERTRIARDIHDVLSHSLSVLSIQVQAARNLRTHHPERLEAKLDDMAALIRESITESRRVVGLLRERPPHASGQDDLSTRLRFITTTFTERTGIHCRLGESGTPRQISSAQKETLELALREMLTNAHRHGAAQTVWITLRWQEARMVLETCDDGMDANCTPHNGLGSSERSNGTGGHHGLQGMRERADALSGEVEAGPVENGGFRVRLSLPYASSSKNAAWRGKRHE